MYDFSTGNVPSITVQTREITNVFPATGSLQGGTELTVTGQGLSTVTSENKVKVGNHDCDVQSSTSTELKCVIADTGKIHYVTNDGIHPGRDNKFSFAYILKSRFFYVPTRILLQFMAKEICMYKNR